MNRLDEMINNLRDDAPVFPMWKIGDLKAWRDAEVAKAILEEFELLPAWNNCICQCMSCKVIGGRIAQLKANTESMGGESDAN